MFQMNNKRTLNKKALSLVVPSKSVVSRSVSSSTVGSTSSSQYSPWTSTSSATSLSLASPVYEEKTMTASPLAISPDEPSAYLRPAGPQRSLSIDTDSAGSTPSVRTPRVATEDSRKGKGLLRSREDDAVAGEEFPYANGPRHIVNNIYLGSETNAADAAILERFNIGYVLNVAEEIPCPWGVASGPTHFTSPNVTYLTLPWTHDEPDIVESFGTAFGFLDAHTDRNILVHCQCGVSRSATLLIAYYMRLHSLSMNHAYASVKDKSPWVGPNLSLVFQLAEYERTLPIETHASPDSPDIHRSLHTKLSNMSLE